MSTANSAYTIAVNAAVETAKTRILEYLKNPTEGQTFGHLQNVCDLRAGRTVEGNGAGLPETRVLDRALQGLRKAGKVEFRNRQWFLTG
jgi:hypothetical protein